jgi:hypothetical protein
VKINGDMHVESWGTSYFPLEPGHHAIEIGFRYFFGANMGRAAAEFDVIAGHVVQVTYQPPAQIFAAGSIVID